MIRRRSGAALLLVAAALVAAPGVANADTDPAGCTDDLQYDPSIPTYNFVLTAITLLRPGPGRA